VTITPSGLAIDNSPMTKGVDGHVVLAEVADLNVDGSPEIYVYAQSAGSGRSDRRTGPSTRWQGTVSGAGGPGASCCRCRGQAMLSREDSTSRVSHLACQAGTKQRHGE
jgi:hypothetical protein